MPKTMQIRASALGSKTSSPEAKVRYLRRSVPVALSYRRKPNGHLFRLIVNVDV